MTLKEKKYYENIRSTFIGRKIVEVYYEELDYGTDSEFWEYAPDIHSVDMNVIFLFDNSDLIQIKWDNEFYCYGVGFAKIQDLKNSERLKTIRLTENKNWDKLVENQITGISVFWDVSAGTETLYENHVPMDTQKISLQVPQTWQIEFEGEKIWISALEIKDGKTDSYWADHLTILFSNHAKEKFGLIKNARKENTIA